MDELFKEEIKILSLDKVTLFHGTSYISFLGIQEKGFMPKPPDEFVYFSSIEDIAEKYARFAVARDKFAGKQPINAGVVFSVELNGKDLEHDRFNLMEEPFQYKTKKIIMPKQIKNVRFVTFDDLDERVELLETVSAFFGGVEKAINYFSNENKGK